MQTTTVADIPKTVTLDPTVRGKRIFEYRKRENLTGQSVTLVPAGQTHTLPKGHMVDVFTTDPNTAIRYHAQSKIHLTGPLFFRARKHKAPDLWTRITQHSEERMLGGFTALVAAGFSVLIGSTMQTQAGLACLLIAAFATLALGGSHFFRGCMFAPKKEHLNSPTPKTIQRLPGITWDDVVADTKKSPKEPSQ